MQLQQQSFPPAPPTLYRHTQEVRHHQCGSWVCSGPRMQKPCGCPITALDCVCCERSRLLCSCNRPCPCLCVRTDSMHSSSSSSSYCRVFPRSALACSALRLHAEECMSSWDNESDREASCTLLRTPDFVVPNLSFCSSTPGFVEVLQLPVSRRPCKTPR